MDALAEAERILLRARLAVRLEQMWADRLADTD